MEIHELSFNNIRSSFVEKSQHEEQNALSQIFDLMQAIELLMQQKQRACFDVVREDLKRYQEESAHLTGERNWQGWSVASLTCAGGMLMGLSPLVSSINDLDPTFKTLIDSLGGVEIVKKLCDTGSQFSEGIKPVANVWSEGKIASLQTNEQLLQMAYSQGQRAAEQSSSTVEKLAQAALRLHDSHMRTLN